MTMSKVTDFFTKDDLVDMETMTITPEIAKNILEQGNYNNRAIRKGHVHNLAARIVRGEWKLTPQGIILHKSGRLLDGQHRLEAVVLANIPITTTVFTVADDEIFRALDQGAKRNMADLANVDKRVMDTVNFCTRLMLNRFTSVSFDQVEPVLNSSVGELSHELIDFCGVARKGLSSSPVKAACVSAVVFGSPKEYAFNLYRDLLQHDYNNLPLIGQSFLKQMHTGSVDFSKANGGKNTYSRCVKLFDYSRRDTRIIRIPPKNMADQISHNAKRLKLVLTQEGSLKPGWGAR